LLIAEVKPDHDGVSSLCIVRTHSSNPIRQSRAMNVANQSFWSLGVISHSFQERQVLDMLGNSLRLVYGEADCERLPEHLQELVSQLQAVEHGPSDLG
jgi:hypothetical protein